MSQSKHAEKLEEVIAQKERLADLTKKLGEGFEQLVKNLEAAEVNLASFVDAQSPNEETQRDVLQFMSAHFAAKTGLYGAGVVLGYVMPPPFVFGILQNRVLAGFHAALLKHQEHCHNPQCPAAAPLEAFLSGIAETVNRMETESIMQYAQRDATGKPIVH